MSDTLLAHLVRSFGQGAENLATEALAFVLRHHEVADAFQRHLRRFAPNLPELRRYRTQIGGVEDAGIRDLVGITEDNTTALVVEAKFEAPLTANQPVTYLAALREISLPSLLIFLAPTTRAAGLWPRLLNRCAQGGVALDEVDDETRVARVGSVTIAVTTWGRLLDDLSGIPLSSDNEQVLSEIAQLRGLVAREDRSGFKPFGRAFLEGDTGRYLRDLDSLLIESVEVLRHRGMAVTKGYKWTGSHDWFGKYFGFGSTYALLHVNFTRWGELADTPMWLRVYPRDDPRVGDALSDLRSAEPRGLFDDDGRLQIPVYLPADGDRDECLAAIVETASRVYGLIADLPAVPTLDQPAEDEDDSLESEEPEPHRFT